MEQSQKHENNAMVKLATFIVDKRNLFFLLTIIGLVFSAFSRNCVEVENDLLSAGRFRDEAGAERHGGAVHDLRHS